MAVIGEQNTQYYPTLIHLVMADNAYSKDNGMHVCTFTIPNISTVKPACVLFASMIYVLYISLQKHWLALKTQLMEIRICWCSCY